ncbi:unnamed protein product [Diatraea saccharalis]|uniref:MICOS complex subunit MIC60 n=1 Tax=Diatraea saccharalis TaxID=40085 RepID=A0A9N9RCC2_9NEOP|nr:unnamed protein product [Diatraea saccharalis]
MAAKLKVVEDKLNARLKAEKETRRSQQLWSAGASLLAATQKGDPFVRVDKELKAIEKAKGDGDKLVETVLKAIPESVRTQGIVPESVLKERYHRFYVLADGESSSCGCDGRSRWGAPADIHPILAAIGGALYEVIVYTTKRN